MEAKEENLVAEIESWLEVIFFEKNLKNISVEIEGNSERGDGYIGDVVFVHVYGTSEDGLKKEYDLVLKCSKRSQILRKNAPVKEAFFNEMYFYNTALPIFTKFQLEKGIDKPFNSTPKYFGMFHNENMEILALINLKKKGYYLWDKKNPLTRKHIDLVVKEYGKLHAISVAMREQKPKEFKEISNSFIDVWKLFTETGSMDALFGSAVQQAYDVLIDDLSEDILLKWKNFKNQAEFVFKVMIRNFTGLKVITHGDCWNNNFMFKNEDEVPKHVALLDWQITNLSSPIFDLSYFLFSCISKDDIDNMDTILETYYTSFSNYVKRLGSNPDALYPFNQFLNEWKKYSKFGVFLSAVVMRLCSLDREDTPDITESAEKGEDMSSAFSVEVKDKVFFKDRMKHIVKYSVENGLTDCS